MFESIEKLREWSHWLDCAYATSDGAFYEMYSAPLSDGMKSCGLMMREKCDVIEREIAERYIELPLDANGVPIRLGDTVREVDDRVPTKVMSLTFYEDCVDVNTCGMNPNLLRHVKPRTIEDVLERFKTELLGIWGYTLDEDIPDMEDALLAKYEAEIRKVVGE